MSDRGRSHGSPTGGEPGHPGPSRSLATVTGAMAVACGLAAASLYYSQPLLDLLGADFGVSPGTATLAVTCTQVGYALGILFVLPLGDLIENRRLVTVSMASTIVALLLAGVAPTFAVFAVASFAIGVTAVVAQVLIALAANLAPDAQRGRVIGRVMSGLLLGILLARTVASWLAAATNWRVVYGAAALVALVAIAVLRRVLPRRQPLESSRYTDVLRSTVALARAEPVLRRRAASQLLLFGAFSVFWTTISYELIGDHGVSQAGVGLFALVGAAGAVAAPLAGALGDRGHGTVGRGAMLGLGVVAMTIAVAGSQSLVLLAVAGFLLDVAVQGHQVLNQRDVYSLRPEARARTNTVYMTVIFTGAAIITAIAGAVLSLGGWTAVALFALGLIVVDLGLWVVTEHAFLAARGRAVRPG